MIFRGKHLLEGGIYFDLNVKMVWHLLEVDPFLRAGTYEKKHGNGINYIRDVPKH